MNKPLWPHSRFNLTTPLSLILTIFCVVAGVVIYIKGLPYEGSALVYMAGGVCFSFPYYTVRYTRWMTFLVMMSILPMTIWLQNKGVETEAWIYRAPDTYWLWITKDGEGWWTWTKHLWLGNNMPAMEYIFYPLFFLFQMTMYSLYSHLLPDKWFEEPRPALRWVFPTCFPLLLAGFIVVYIKYAHPGKTDYPFWMTSMGYLLTGAAFCISKNYRKYTRSIAYWIWILAMGIVFLIAWEFFHSCVNHDWVYVEANMLPFVYTYNGAGIPVTQFFGYITTATTFQALMMLMILRFGHIVIKDRKLVPFSGK
jgi:hypothetical protein